MNGKSTVSKVRARKTKSREKQAGREKAPRQPLAEHPAIGLLIALVLLVCTVLVTGAEHLVRGEIDAALLLRLLGDGGLLLISLLATGMFLKTIQPGILKHNMTILMLAAIVFLSAVMGKIAYVSIVDAGFMGPASAPYFLPVEMAPLLAAILVNGPVAIAIGLWTTLVMGVLAGHNFVVIVVGAVATMVTARTAYRVRTRSKVARTGLLIGLCKVACVIAFVTLGNGQPTAMDVLNRAGACVISGFISAIIVLLVLPLFELLFRVTTDITLLELSDLGHPLLQRLALEAPGTYHHSLVVANLAQAAAERIGANSLLTRVAAYFHDVGKLTKPSFFTENMQMERNPHDDLPPSMSTLVITSHVKEGLSLAVLYKLPRPIVDIIVEHHGTSVISYFHNKARTQLEAQPEGERGTPQAAGNKAQLDDSSFRYTGPRPSTRESAIICLADAAEAASRSIEKKTPSHIENVVDGIVCTRIDDHQLDDSGLTLSELAQIKTSFVFSLTNMLHGRIPYPKNEDRHPQPPKQQRDPAPGAATTGPQPYDASQAA